jgi:hypothetical protein
MLTSEGSPHQSLNAALPRLRSVCCLFARCPSQQMGRQELTNQPLTGIFRSVSEGRLPLRSPRIRTLTVTAQLHHLRWPLDHLASLSGASSPSAYASYDVLVHQLAALLAASFRPFLADWPLPFTSSYRLITKRLPTVIFLQRTFTSLVNAHVGRTPKNQADAKNARLI